MEFGLLQVVRAGIDTDHEPVVFVRRESPACRVEGLAALGRACVRLGERSVVATVHLVTSGLLGLHQAGLSEAAWQGLGANEGDLVALTQAQSPGSFAAVRAKIYGRSFSDADLHGIARDIAQGQYSPVELAAFVTACASQRMSDGETLAFTRAMVQTGNRLSWTDRCVVDKHCVGGLPGNRTTPLVVAIAAACGITIPKTSSRAITSPAGTADTMETLAPVDLGLEHMRRVVEREGGCVVWGGAMQLSPVDDLLIRIERPLDFDSNNQIVASIISKKVAAGSTHLLLDLPVGPTAKLRSAQAATELGAQLQRVGAAMGLTLRVLQTDGSQPVGSGIGPALEARDVLAVLQGLPSAPADLRDRAVHLAGHLLELGGKAPDGQGERQAAAVLADGRAWRKFQAICAAQGGMREPPVAPLRHALVAPRTGVVACIDNRRLSRAAKLAGAPHSPAAGLELHTRIGARVNAGQPLFTLHAQAPGELATAQAWCRAGTPIIEVTAA